MDVKDVYANLQIMRNMFVMYMDLLGDSKSSIGQTVLECIKTIDYLSDLIEKSGGLDLNNNYN